MLFTHPVASRGRRARPRTTSHIMPLATPPRPRRVRPPLGPARRAGRRARATASTAALSTFTGCGCTCPPAWGTGRRAVEAA
eukprot:1218831-Prymnesium_polylepis.1